jgi:16S rRNA (guanine966-N2)-methyltransferase
MFNSLVSMDLVEGRRFVDLFAGTGALGIEAWSRGAAEVTFVEHDRRVLAVLRANVRDLGITEQRVVAEDSMAWIARPQPQFDVALCDPPYDFAAWPELFAAVPAATVVAESGSPLEVPEGWEVLRRRRYGRSHVLVASRVGYGERPPAGPTSGGVTAS